MRVEPLSSTVEPLSSTVEPLTSTLEPLQTHLAQYSGEGFNSPVAERPNKGLMDNPQLWHFFGVRKYLGGELNSPVVEWLNKGLMSVSSPNK